MLLYHTTSIAILAAMCTIYAPLVVDAALEEKLNSRIRQRNLKSPKSPKSSKVTIIKDFCPVSTVTAQVNDVQGNTAVVSGTEVQDAFAAATAECNTLTSSTYGQEYADCISQSDSNGELFYYPLFPRNNDGTSATSQFVSAATDASGAGGASPGSLNDSYFKGDVNCDGSCPTNKVDIQWIDYSLNEVFNVPIADIEYIQYDFFPLTCGTMSNATCIKQFYLGVYTHRSSGGGTWYDCRLNFIPTESPGEVEVGKWNTFTITSDTVSSSYERKGACPDGSGGLITSSSGQITPGVAAFEDGTSTSGAYEFLLGAAGQPTNADNPLIFAFNMGDSSATDNGLVGYFDNIRIKIKNKDLIIYDL